MSDDVLTMDDYYDANDGFGHMYTWLHDVLSDDDIYALDIVIDILGMSTDTIDTFLKTVYGYDFEQFYEEENKYL